MNDFDDFWLELEKEKMLGIEPDTLRRVIERLLAESNLRLKDMEENEKKDIIATSADCLGKETKTLIRVEKETRGIDKDDIEDFFEDLSDLGSLNGIVIINSYFTKDAKEYASGLPIRLVDRKEISDLVCMVEAIKLEKAFISEIDDTAVMRHFRNKSKLSATGFILLNKERVEEVDRRYLPIARFSIRRVESSSEAHKIAYIDLSSGDLYYVDEGALKTTDVLRKILELPLETRNELLDLIEHGSLPKENLSDKSVNILTRYGLIDIHDKKSGGGLVAEVLAIISFIVAEIVEPIGIERGSYRDPATQSRKYVSATVKTPPLDLPYDLEYFMEVSKTDEGFDADAIKYKPEEVADFLRKVTHSTYVDLNHVVYLPYYIARFSGPRGTRYERTQSLKFKDFFPKTSSFSALYQIIDKFPDLPYIVVACFYLFFNMNESVKMIHTLSSTLIFVTLMVVVGAILKSIFRTQRTTPFYGTNDYGLKALRYGFPSMHALSSVGAVAFTWFVDPQGPLLALVLTPIAALYIYSRLRIGAHNTADVIGGIVVGLFLGIMSGIYVLATYLPPIVESLFAIVVLIALIASIVARIRYMH